MNGQTNNAVMSGPFAPEFRPVIYGLVTDLAEKLKSTPDVVALNIFNTLAHSLNGAPSQDEVIQFASICAQTGLNPLVKTEIVPMYRNGVIQIIIMRDGWVKILRSQPTFDGVGFEFSPEMVRTSEGREVPAWVDCTIYEKGISHPMTWRTVFKESTTNSKPWKDSPTNMLQLRALARAVRNCFGISVYSPDEAEDFLTAAVTEEREPVRQEPQKPLTNEQKVLTHLAKGNSEGFDLEGDFLTPEPEKVPARKPRAARSAVKAKETVPAQAPVAEGLPLPPDLPAGDDVPAYGTLNGADEAYKG